MHHGFGHGVTIQALWLGDDAVVARRGDVQLAQNLETGRPRDSHLNITLQLHTPKLIRKTLDLHNVDSWEGGSNLQVRYDSILLYTHTRLIPLVHSSSGHVATCREESRR